jgi:hypothetical protein
MLSKLFAMSRLAKLQSLRWTSSMFIGKPPNVANTSVVHHEPSCTPLPCGRFSRPPTTMGAPPLGRIIGRCFGPSEGWPSRVTTILSRASLVPMLTLGRSCLDSDPFYIPDSGPLLPWTSRGNWFARESGAEAVGRRQRLSAFGRPRHPLIPGSSPERL